MGNEARFASDPLTMRVGRQVENERSYLWHVNEAADMALADGPEGPKRFFQAFHDDFAFFRESFRKDCGLQCRLSDEEWTVVYPTEVSSEGRMARMAFERAILEMLFQALRPGVLSWGPPITLKDSPSPEEVQHAIRVLKSRTKFVALLMSVPEGIVGCREQIVEGATIATSGWMGANLSLRANRLGKALHAGGGRRFRRLLENLPGAVLTEWEGLKKEGSERDLLELRRRVAKALVKGGPPADFPRDFKLREEVNAEKILHFQEEVREAENRLSKARLSADELLILKLKIEDSDRTGPEIAEMLGTTPESVRQGLHRLRKKLIKAGFVPNKPRKGFQDLRRKGAPAS